MKQSKGALQKALQRTLFSSRPQAKNLPPVGEGGDAGAG
jgi:hypothetical protein